MPVDYLMFFRRNNDIIIIKKQAVKEGSSVALIGDACPSACLCESFSLSPFLVGKALVCTCKLNNLADRIDIILMKFATFHFLGKTFP